MFRGTRIDVVLGVVLAVVVLRPYGKVPQPTSGVWLHTGAELVVDGAAVEIDWVEGAATEISDADVELVEVSLLEPPIEVVNGIEVSDDGDTVDVVDVIVVEV